LVIESFVWYLLFGGPLNEEPGWRGFALTRLQPRSNPLAASLIIGLCSGLWHVPLHLMGVFPGGQWGAVIRIFDIPTAILFTWLFNRTGGSLLPVLFLHSARNTTSLFLSRDYVISSLLLLMVAIGLVFLDTMWRPLSKTREVESHALEP
jgi:membrane protease YdiL (CAAX protease family)